MSRRITILQGHLAAPVDAAQPLEANETSAALPDPRLLYPWLVRDNRELREAIFDFVGSDPLYEPNYALSLAGTREITSQRVAKFVAQRFFSVADYTHNPLKFQAALESITLCDYSLGIKCGVHFTLCGGTVCKLGTERHHREILPEMDTLELPGCFGMTELGHGSNVMGIETTASYDAAAQEFVINSPSKSAAKYWIGGAGSTAKICAVFAQLTINGQWQGPHVFMVRVRDDYGTPARGVTIRDHGPKMGLNGVDNGSFLFDNVRVPRTAMLDRFASVDAAGRYSSPIANPGQRFGTMISGLTTGRMLIAQAAVDACKVGVAIAIRYSVARPQFGDVAIIDYVTQQRALIPGLATTYAMQLAMARCKALALSSDSKSGGGGAEAAKAVHVLSSGLKAAATWHRLDILQKCREGCGGMGFLAANRIGPMLNDMNVDTTFEGVNTVMMMSAARPAVESAVKARQLAAPAPPRVNTTDLGLGCVKALLEWRQAALTAEIAAEVAAAAARGGPKAAAAAMEVEGDRVVSLGWAGVDSSSYNIFLEEISAPGAPAAWRSTLSSLALLYGLSRVETGLADYLAGGALPAGAAAGALRRKVNALCGELAADGAAKARALCGGFGMPDHLIRAPIAVGDWRDL